MKQRTYSLVIMTTVSGGLGGLIGACVGPWWLAVILTIVSALAMYLAHEWRCTLQAINVACEEVSYWDIKSMIKAGGYGLLCSIWIGLLIFLLFLSLHVTSSEKDTLMKSFVIGVIYVAICLVILIYLIAREREDGGELVRRLRTLALSLAPPVLIFWHGGRMAIKIIPLLIRLAWRVFLVIHSERRVICAASVFVGALAGFILRVQSSATSIAPITAVLIGAVCGLMFGLVSHELIAKRWLLPRGHLPIKS